MNDRQFDDAVYNLVREFVYGQEHGIKERGIHATSALYAAALVLLRAIGVSGDQAMGMLAEAADDVDAADAAFRGSLS